MKAFGYCRVSGLGQVDGDGIPRQRLAIDEYAAANGIEIARWFIDAGVKGTKDLDDRPALSELWSALSEGEVSTIIFEKLDRMARDLLIQERIIEDMTRKGYKLVSTMEPDLCSTEPSRIFIRQIMGAMAQYDRSTLVLKMKVAKDRIRAKTGRCEGRKPYGAKPGEEATLARMRELFAADLGFQKIADTLNAEGMLSREGKPWRVGSVHRIITRQ